MGESIDGKRRDVKEVREVERREREVEKEGSVSFYFLLTFFVSRDIRTFALLSSPNSGSTGQANTVFGVHL